MRYTLLLLLAAFCLAFINHADAQNQAAASHDSAQSAIQKIGDDQYQLGNARIDAKARVITLPGKINMQKGMIELIACAPGGKAHESVLMIDVVPYHLQVALILLGLNYVGGLSVQGDTVTPKGDLVDVNVTWKTAAGQDTTVRAEDLAWDIPRKASMRHTSWVFTGSKMSDGKYMADMEKSLITTYRDPFTILDNPLSTGSDDEVYRVNDSITPPKGTPVTVTITPAQSSIH